MTTESSNQDGQLAAKISNAVVGALSRTTGRGPTQAKTTLGTNGVFVVLQDTLTRGEQTLADAGHGEAVLDLRRRWQAIMKEGVSREIEQLTGRKVIGFISDNHIDPDLTVEVFVGRMWRTRSGAARELWPRSALWPEPRTEGQPVEVEPSRRRTEAGRRRTRATPPGGS